VVPEDLFHDDPPLNGDTVLCAERFGTYFTVDRTDRCDFIWRVASGGGVITTPNTLDADTIVVDWANRVGNQGVVCVEVISDCGRRDSCITIDFLPAPAPDAGPDQVVCGQMTQFEGVEDFGGGMWTQIAGPNMATIAEPNNITSDVNVNRYGLFSFVWTEQNLDCAGTDTVDILFAPDPVANNIDTICSSDATEFIVQFEINRGSLPYTILQGAGMIVNDSLFVSDTIADNTPTTITIQDVNGCEFTYFIDYDCICLNEAGEMAMDTIELCGPDAVACGDYDPTNMVLEPGKDTFMYVLYTTVGNIQGSRLQFNQTGCFNFDPATMQLDQVYYIGVVVGRKDQSDLVDWNGGCIQPAEAQPVIWYTIPTPDAGADTSICGQVINLDGTISLNGTTYRWLNTAGATISAQGDLNTSVSVAPAFGTFEFVLEEVNAVCPARDTVAITFNESPTGSPEEICVDFVNFEFIVTFEITQGQPPYTIVQGTGTIDPMTNVYTSDQLPSLVPYTIIIEDANGCQFIINDDHNCDCGNTDPGTMDGPEQACVDQCIDICSNMSEIVQNDEETFFVLHTGSGTVIQNEIQRWPYDHTANPCQPIQVCFDAMTMTPGVTYYVSRLVREAGNPDDPCERISRGQALTWYSYPVADPGTDQDFCGLEGALSATPSLGSGFWTLVNQPAGSNAIFAGGLAQGMVTVDQYGSYTFRWTEDNESCRDSAEVVLTFHDAPVVSNVQFVCDDVAENYTITFNVNNGDQATYEVNGISATQINANEYTAGPFPTGSSISFCATDQWDCQPSCIDTSFICECITEPGTVTSDDILCIDECVQATYNGGVTDANDVIRFVLHDGDAANLGNIIECNATGEFCFDQFAMTANTTYYITALAGNVDPGSDCVDLAERCAVMSAGIPVTWYEYPSPDITQSEPQFTCQIDSMTLDGSASSGPGAISYSWSALNGTICSSSDVTNSSILICAPGRYVLTVTHDVSGCATRDTIDISSDENIPAVSAGPDLELTCDITEVVLDGTGTDTGNDFDIVWTDAQGNVIGNDISVTVNTPGTYTITVVNNTTDCDNTDEVIVTENVDQPTAIIDQIGQLTCTIKEVTLDGVTSITQGGVRSYTWTTNDGEISGSASGSSIIATEEGTYQLIIVDERNGCADTVDIAIDEIGNTLATWDIDPTPPRCAGESNGQVEINGITGGNPPLEYSFNNGPFGTATQFTNLSAGSYEVTVRDANGCEKDTVVVVPETPEIGITAKDDLFKEAGEGVDLDTLILNTFGITQQDADSIVWYDNETGERYGINPASIDSLGRRYTFRVELWNNGCLATDLITIFVKFTRRVYIPNVIVPNGSSTNPENRILTIHANKNRIANINFLRVYDRWGELVYSLDNVPYSEQDGRSTEGWDGTFNGELLNPGVFVYHTQIEFFGGAVEDYFGDVTLLLTSN
jgi:hypothetical protein